MQLSWLEHTTKVRSQVRIHPFRFRIGGGIGKLYCGREVETHSLDDLNASSLIGANPIPTDGTTRR